MDFKLYQPFGHFPATGKAPARAAVFMRGSLLAIILAVFFSGQALAQIPQFFVSGGAGSNSFPFNTTVTKRTQHIYLPGDLPGATGGNITRIYFKASTTVGTGTFSDFVVRLGQTTATVFPGSGSLEFFTGLSTVVSSPSYTLTATATDVWVPIDLQTPFLFDPSQTLIVDIEMSNRTSSTGFTIRTMTVPGAPNHKRLTASTVGAVTGNGSTVWSDFGIDVVPAGPCLDPATPGTISGNLNSCPGQTNNLLLTGYNLGASLQWQSSPDGINWTDITGATTASFTTPQLTASTYYRVNVTCGTTAASPAVQVIVGTGAITSFPHTQNFDNAVAPALPCGWTKVNANNDASTWNVVSNNASSAPNSAMYNYNSTAAADDWLFSPQLSFNGLNHYKVTFKYKNSSASYQNHIEVRWGTAPTAAGMPAANTVFSDMAVNSTTYLNGATASIEPPATGNYYVGFYIRSASGVLSNLFIDDVIFEELVGCSGMPSAGTPPPGPIGYCANATSPILLTVTGAAVAPGIVYQWEESDDDGVTDPWSNVTGGSGATTTEYTLPNNLTTSRYYRLRVTCTNGNQTATTASVKVEVNLPRLCYCITNLHVGSCTPSDHIDSVTIVGTTLINGGSGCSNSNGLAYSKYPASGAFTATLMGGSVYTIGVTSVSSSIISVWIDFNQNGVFEATEWTQITSSSTANQMATAQVTIPTTARNGLTGMRIRSRGAGNPNSSGDACTPFGGGETEDYFITIAGAVGVAEELANAMQVYPNPNNGKFKIEVGDAGSKAMKVELYNTLGQLVFADETKGAYNKEVDVTGIAAGIYILKVEADGVMASRRISIEK